ncbi:MAG: FtsX-like permease family protein, partial [Steroidobacteraceae bacterium]
IPLYALRSQAQAISMGRSTAVVLTQVFSAIGSIALLLAAAGLYGVLAFSVAQRTREIGIRRAIGASSGAIINHVGMQLLLQLAIGLAIGVALALPWSRKLANPLMHTKGYDPGVFLPVLAVIVVIALLASLLPLQKALRVDPVIALRHD